MNTLVSTKKLSRAYVWVAGFSTLLALIVVMLGAYTRLGNAGLGCPDWPGCYGQLTAPHTQLEREKAAIAFPGQVVETPKAWKEMVHRYFAGTLALLILVLMFWGLIRKRFDTAQPIVPIILLFLFIAFQAVLGMWTVTWKVQPLVVTSHLLGGMGITALLWYLTLASCSQPNLAQPQTSKFKPWAIGGLIILIGQLFLGAWTSTNYAALVCPTFPLCQGSFFPAMDFHHAFQLFQPIGINYEGGALNTNARIAIQMMHRYGALLTATYLGLFSVYLLFSKYSQGFRILGGILLSVLSLQFFLGTANVLWLLPMPLAVAHNGVAAILLLVMVTIIYKLFRVRP